MELLTANLQLGVARPASLHGRQYLVAPITSIVPGVLNGSRGALLYPPGQVAANYQSWDGIPLTVYHPEDPSGGHVSANSPGILERQGIGVIRGTTFNGKLTHEGWFDIELTRRADNTLLRDKPHAQILPRLVKGMPIEVSTGLYTDNEAAPPGAMFNGTPYDYVAMNYRPDHMAILPDQVGACSINQGCGVLVNKKGDGVPSPVPGPVPVIANDDEDEGDGEQTFQGEPADGEIAQNDCGGGGGGGDPMTSDSPQSQDDTSPVRKRPGVIKFPSQPAQNVVPIQNSAVDFLADEYLRGIDRSLALNGIAVNANPEGINQYTKGGGGHDKVIAALTKHDQMASKKPGHNPYALGHYMRAAGDAKTDVEAGHPVREALKANFTGRLLDKVLKAAGEPKASNDEHRYAGRGSLVERGVKPTGNATPQKPSRPSCPT